MSKDCENTLFYDCRARGYPQPMSTPQAPHPRQPAVRPVFLALASVFFALPFLALAGLWYDARALSKIAPTPAPAGTPAASMTELDALDYVGRVWAAYDGRPEAQHTAETLGAVRLATLREMEKLPPGIARQAVAKNDGEFRERAARRIIPGETHATGLDGTVLVPSKDKAKCLVCGSQWAGDADTRASMVAMGFTLIECPGKVWRLDLP